MPSGVLNSSLISQRKNDKTTVIKLINNNINMETSVSSSLFIIVSEEKKNMGSTNYIIGFGQSDQKKNKTEALKKVVYH